MADKMKQESGDSSQNIQIAGDVGLYIGSVYLGRVLGMKIPQDIFYQG